MQFFLIHFAFKNISYKSQYLESITIWPIVLRIPYVKDNSANVVVSHWVHYPFKCQLGVVKFNDWLVVILDFAMGQGVLSFMSASRY